MSAFYAAATCPRLVSRGRVVLGLKPCLARPELEEDELEPEPWSLDRRLTLGV